MVVDFYTILDGVDIVENELEIKISSILVMMLRD